MKGLCYVRGARAHGKALPSPRSHLLRVKTEYFAERSCLSGGRPWAAQEATGDRGSGSTPILTPLGGSPVVKSARKRTALTKSLRGPKVQAREAMHFVGHLQRDGRGFRAVRKALGSPRQSTWAAAQASRTGPAPDECPVSPAPYSPTQGQASWG